MVFDLRFSTVHTARQTKHFRDIAEKKARRNAELFTYPSDYQAPSGLAAHAGQTGQTQTQKSKGAGFGNLAHLDNDG